MGKDETRSFGRDLLVGEIPVPPILRHQNAEAGECLGTS